jgi:hypothetical protein
MKYVDFVKIHFKNYKSVLQFFCQLSLLPYFALSSCRIVLRNKSAWRVWVSRCVGQAPTLTRSSTLNDAWCPGKIHHLIIIIFTAGIR